MSPHPPHHEPPGPGTGKTPTEVEAQAGADTAQTTDADPRRCRTQLQVQVQVQQPTQTPATAHHNRRTTTSSLNPSNVRPPNLPAINPARSSTTEPASTGSPATPPHHQHRRTTRTRHRQRGDCRNLLDQVQPQPGEEQEVQVQVQAQAQVQQPNQAPATAHHNRRTTTSSLNNPSNVRPPNLPRRINPASTRHRTSINRIPGHAATPPNTDEPPGPDTGKDADELRRRRRSRHGCRTRVQVQVQVQQPNQTPAHRSPQPSDDLQPQGPEQCSPAEPPPPHQPHPSTSITEPTSTGSPGHAAHHNTDEPPGPDTGEDGFVDAIFAARARRSEAAIASRDRFEGGGAPRSRFVDRRLETPSSLDAAEFEFADTPSCGTHLAGGAPWPIRPEPEGSAGLDRRPAAERAATLRLGLSVRGPGPSAYFRRLPAEVILDES